MTPKYMLKLHRQRLGSPRPRTVVVSRALLNVLIFCDFGNFSKHSKKLPDWFVAKQYWSRNFNLHVDQDWCTQIYKGGEGYCKQTRRQAWGWSGSLTVSRIAVLDFKNPKSVDFYTSHLSTRFQDVNCSCNFREQKARSNTPGIPWSFAIL